MGRASDDSGSGTDINREQCRREDRKKYIDKIAAIFILQGYLDSVYLKK